MILEQARKQNVGVIVAHQYLTQLSQKTLDSLYANTSIKFAGGISDKDAYALARNMRCEPSFIAEQPKGSFASYVRNTTKNAVSLKFPFIQLGKVRMKSEQYAKVLDKMRARYAVHYTKLLTSPPAPAVPTPAATTDIVGSAPTTESETQSTPAKPGQVAKPKERQKWPM